MKRLFVTLCILLLLTFTFARAQDATPEVAAGWTIEQRCVGEPTTPPDDWSFDGTILTSNEIGVRGIRSDWETPHILAFTDVGGAETRLFGGALSPDMQWYVAAEGDSQCDGSCNSYSVNITRLHLFNLNGNDPRQSTPITWDLFYNAHIGGNDSPRVTWLNNDTFLYPFTVRENSYGWGTTELRLLNPFTADTSLWTNIVDPTIGRFVSPDLTRDFAIEWIEGIRHVYLIDTATQQRILEFEPDFIPLLAATIWSPDSQYFISARQIDEDYGQLELRDKDGGLISVIMTVLLPNLFYPNRNNNDFFWSPNSRYLSINIGQSIAEGRTLTDYTSYMIDLQEQTIIDLCLFPVYYPVWSLTSEEVAFWNYEIQIINLDSLVRYIVAYDAGIPIGWRADD